MKIIDTFICDLTGTKCNVVELADGTQVCLESDEYSFSEEKEIMWEKGFEWCYDKQEYVPIGDAAAWFMHPVDCNCYNCL